MPESLYDIEPGTLTQAGAIDLLATRAADRIIQTFPLEFQAGIALAQITAAAAGAIYAAASSGPLAIGIAVVKAFQALNSALTDWANHVQQEIAQDWSDALETLGTQLVQAAKGNILALYQPAASLTNKRAQAKTGKPLKKLSQLEAQFRPGYVLGVERPMSSDYIVATVPILIFTGAPLGITVRESIYSGKPSSSIGMMTEANGWAKDNTWKPLGLADYDDVYLPAGWKWSLTAAELKNAHASPPLRQRIQVAPGLAPTWGPYGDRQPVPQSLAAYSAALLGSPPPDLDKAANAIWDAQNTYALNPLSTPIVDLLWAREDKARRGEIADKPRGDAWAGMFGPLVGLEPKPFPKGGVSSQALPGWKGIKTTGGGGKSSSSGAGTIVVVLAAGAAGYVLLRRRRS